MGIFRRLFGGRPPRPPRPPPAPPPVAFEPPSFPFSGEIRLRHEDYDRLSTGWWQVAVNSPAEWDAKVTEMREGLRRHFGILRLRDGRVVPRWNERTWARVQQDLVVETR